MPTTCPSCLKSLNGTADAVFCMYCGHRLRPGGDTPPGLDPNETTDMPTRAYVPGEPADDTPLPALDRIGAFRLVRAIGSGGMGSVYEAEADDNGERVAIKLLSPKLTANPISIERFKQEGRLASQLNHPRCVFVYGADTDAGRPFIVMELMPGTTLKDLVDQRGPLPVGEAVARVLDVIDGLIEAHRLGLIHRDVKPSNCFLTDDDRVKVGDFGLSKSLLGSGSDKQLTSSGTFLGTVLFASPEQIRGEEVGYDSDVYSVAATLYFLLAGQAPYQHESLTAALAKAISEPPPRLRRKRSDVPGSLERAILRGLERDRNRRWDTLEEFRDALADQLPAKQVPARPRAVIAAYLIDFMLILLLVQVPIGVLETVAGGGWVHPVIGIGILDPLGLTLATLYFGLLEGRVGTTVGKWLLRLRVRGIGQLGPPGIGPAAVRAVVFNIVFWVATLSLPGWLLDLPYVGVPLALAAFVGGVYVVALQFRASRNYGGLHDTVSGCQVVQLPRAAHRVRLGVRAGHPFDRVAASDPPLPEMVGGFAVRGLLTGAPGREMVWAAEDRSLGRRILLWVRPAGTVDGAADLPSAVRPTRLRAVGNGDVLWNGAAYWWVAFVVPAGGPLPDVVGPSHPLSWADARPVIEQTVEELIAAKQDGTLPGRLGVDQIWVELSGRAHLLDFPVPTAAAPGGPASDPLGLIRQLTTLLLEGTARDAGGRVAAPMPLHASKITDRLFETADPFPDVAAVQAVLGESHAAPARVTSGMRAAQVGVTAMLAGTGLLMMFATALGYHLMTGWLSAAQVQGVEMVLAGVKDAEIRERWAAHPPAAQFLAPGEYERTVARLEQFIAEFQAAVDAEARTLTAPERYFLRRVSESPLPAAAAAGLSGEEVVPILRQLRVVERRGVAQFQRASTLAVFRVFLVFFIAAYVVFAFAFRGGLSFVLAGLALVRRDGKPAGRFRCAARELLLWLPIVLMLTLAVAVQDRWPDWSFGRAVVSGAAVALLAAYALYAVRVPGRGPHDRLVGTYVVPA